MKIELSVSTRDIKWAYDLMKLVSEAGTGEVVATHREEDQTLVFTLQSDNIMELVNELERKNN